MDSLVIDNPSLLYEEEPTHVPPTQSPDTLFNFVSNIEYLFKTIDTKLLSPWYCAEDISYLHIEGVDRIAIPMKCFCDIRLHNLKHHIRWYGSYGIAFSKEFAIKNGIQPVHYLNPHSELTKNISSTFNLVKDDNREDKNYNELKDFLMHTLMFCKPNEGTFINRITKEKETKCFTDECEWRFVPNVSSVGYQQIIFDTKVIDDKTVMSRYSTPLSEDTSVSIPFSYSDIKHIILKTDGDFTDFVEHLNNIELSPIERDRLIAKIIIWELSEGDF